MSLVLTAVSLFATSARAAAGPSPLPVLALHDGRVLHHAACISDEGSSVVIRSDEGLIKVDKADLPEGVVLSAPPAAKSASTEIIVHAFDPDKTPQDVDSEAGVVAKPAAGSVANPTPAPRTPSVAYKGCSIISFEMKPFQNILGCAEVVIHNDSESSVQLHPRDFACVLAGGGRRVGRNFVAIQFLPPAIRRLEVVGPGANDDFIVTFDNAALDISGVQWAH